MRLMHRRNLLSLLACLAASSAAAQPLTLPRADGGSTPVRIFGPASGCHPTAIMSHGFGGDENGNAGVAAVLGRRGWRVIAMSHRESGRGRISEALLSGSPRRNVIGSANDPALHRLRFLDLDAAVIEARRPCRPPQMILVGHSMGAMTTMLEAGARARFGAFGGDRFDLYVPISPQGIGVTYAAGAWSGVRRPVLMITGTSDRGADGDYRTRLSAFEGLPQVQKRLAIIPDATHIQLSGGPNSPHSETVAELIDGFARAARAKSWPPPLVAGVDIRDR
jgi:pimeloyl-ACP methyl ester carboxylesterase